jgi:hypothetical protein
VTPRLMDARCGSRAAARRTRRACHDACPLSRATATDQCACASTAYGVRRRLGYESPTSRTTAAAAFMVHPVGQAVAIVMPADASSASGQDDRSYRCECVFVVGGSLQMEGS